MAEQDSNQEQTQVQFALNRIYIKDLSFEIPKSPEIFRIKWEPNVGLNIKTEHTKVEENIFEVTLIITTKVQTAGEVAYIAEVQQAGIFLINGVEGEALEHTLGAYCPNILFPYAREALDSLATRGSFPAMMLAPINFDALYEHQKEATAN